MKLDYPNNKHPKGKSEFVSVGLLGVSAFMGVLILIKLTAFFAAPVRAQNSVKKAAALSKLDSEEVEKHLAKSKDIVDQLKKNNLFAPPPPKKHPVNQVSGILGNEALINGKWYKAGDTVGDAKIVAIEPTQVKIEWEGSEKVFDPISAVSAPLPKKVVAKGDVKEKPEQKKVEKAAEAKVAAPSAEDPLAWMGVDLPPKAREMILQQWNNASDEEKAQAKEHWNSMPDDQKQQAIEAMERMDGQIGR